MPTLICCALAGAKIDVASSDGMAMAVASKIGMATVVARSVVAVRRNMTVSPWSKCAPAAYASGRESPCPLWEADVGGGVSYRLREHGAVGDVHRLKARSSVGSESTHQDSVQRCWRKEKAADPGGSGSAAWLA